MSNRLVSNQRDEIQIGPSQAHDRTSVGRQRHGLPNVVAEDHRLVYMVPMP